MSYSMGDAIGYIKLNIQDFKQKYQEVHDKSEALDKVVSDMGHVFDIAGKVAAAAFAGISVAATKAVKSVLDVGSSFEAAMSQVAATMGMTADEVANGSDAYEKLSASAKEMGASTKYSATQAAESLNYLALAGYSVDESVSVLPKVLDVAAAGGMDLAKASDMVTDAMSALGLPLEQVDSFVDKLAKTSQKSNTSVSQLGEAILQIGGTAKSLAGGVTELDTALGILANNGIKAAEGGTALRQIILNLTAPTQQAAEYMQSLGFSAYDAAGNMKPLNQTFAELDEIMSEMSTQQEKDNVLTSIFDARQLKSARALISGYASSWDELEGYIENADGAAHKMAETMQENLTGAVTIAKSALEGVQVTAFEAMEKGLTTSVRTATTAIDAFNKKLQTPEMQEALNRIGQLLGDILVKFTEFITNSAIPTAIQWFKDFDEVSNLLKSTLTGLAAALPIVAAGYIACNEAVQLYIAKQIAAKAATIATNAAMLANPYTAVAVAIGVLVAACKNYVSEMHRVIDMAKNEVTEHSKAAQAARDNADALAEARTEAEKTASSNNEQINQIRTLTNMLGEYANRTNLTAEELANAESIIAQLNEIYPENTAYIEDGQVKAYEDLTRAVENYTEKLWYQKQLEAAQDYTVQAYDSMKQAEKSLEGQAEKVDELRQKYLEAQKEYDYYISGGIFSQNYTDTAKKEAKEMGMTIREYYAYKAELAKADWENEAEAYSINKQTLDQAQKDYKKAEDNMLDLRLKSGEKVEGIYSSQQEAERDIRQKESEQRQAQERELHKDEIAQQQKEAEEKEKAKEKMWKDLAETDRKWQLKQYASEEEYQKERKKILESGRDEYDDKWVKEYSKSLDYEEEMQEKATEEAKKQEEERTEKEKEEAEKRKKLREEEIDSQIEDYKLRNETDEKYTKEMMYNDMENLISGLDKNSEQWKKYNKEIILGRKDLNDELLAEDKKRQEEEQKQQKEAEEKAKAEAEKQFSTWTQSYDNLVSEAKSAYSEIKSAQENLSNELINSVKLYETETTKVWNAQKRAYEEKEVFTTSSKAIKQQTKEIDNYTKTLEELEKKGLSDDLMAKITSMGVEEGAKFAESLNSMSKKELAEYSNSYDELISKSEEFSEKYYSKQIETFEKDYKNKFENLFAEMPANTELVGKETIDGFIKGIEEKNEETEGAFKNVMDNAIAKTKETLGIHSPSKVYEEMGKNVTQGFINGISELAHSVTEKFSNLGKSSAESFTSAFKNIWSSFSEFLSSDIEKINKINSYAAGMSGFTLPMPQGTTSSNVNAGVSAQYNNQTVKTLTKADIVSAIKEASPDGNVIFQMNGRQFAIIAREELNRLSHDTGNLQLKT